PNGKGEDQCQQEKRRPNPATSVFLVHAFFLPQRFCQRQRRQGTINDSAHSALSLIWGSVSGAISRKISPAARRISPRGCQSSLSNCGTAGRAAQPQARIPSSASNFISGQGSISRKTGNVWATSRVASKSNRAATSRRSKSRLSHSVISLSR